MNFEGRCVIHFQWAQFNSLFLRDSSVCKKFGTFKANKVWSSPVWCIFQGPKWRKFPDVSVTDRQTDRQTENSLLLVKWFPLQGERAHSLYFWSFQKQNREGGRATTTDLSIYSRLYHRLQVHHLTLIFIIHQHYIYIHTYMNSYS